MKKKILMLGLIVSFFISCKEKNITQAKIVERKTVNNQIQLKYSYNLNNQHYLDSQLVANKVIPHDSVDLLIEGEKHQLLIP